MAEKLLEISIDDGLPSVIRASALDLLRAPTDERIAARAAPLLADADPLVRSAAIGVQRGAVPIERMRRLIPLFEDPMRSVRIAAAREILDTPVAGLPPSIAAAAEKATEEWRASLLAKADYPEIHIAIGGAALVMRNPQAAEKAFRETVRLDPQMVVAWTMIVRILTAVGDRDGAKAALEGALAANPSDEGLRSPPRDAPSITEPSELYNPTFLRRSGNVARRRSGRHGLP